MKNTISQLKTPWAVRWTRIQVRTLTSLPAIHRHLQQTGPRTRGDLQYCCDLTLDPNTANSFQRPSRSHDRPRAAAVPWSPRALHQLGSSLVHWRSLWIWILGGGVGRRWRSFYCRFLQNWREYRLKLGCNSKSCLDFSDFLCLFWHNKFSVEIHTPMPHRVGVYLDHRAGTLEFYWISLAEDTMTLLHRE